MFADIWLRTGLISQDVRILLVHPLGRMDAQSLQIISAHVNFLKTVNFAAVAPSTLNITGVGIPLDSLRPNNVTYSPNQFIANPSNIRALISHDFRLKHVHCRFWGRCAAGSYRVWYGEPSSV